MTRPRSAHIPRRADAVRGGLLIGLLILNALSGSTALRAQGPPPAGLHLEGDHWTAWDPPQTVPEGAQVYTIATGDTLWGLAQRFWGDAYLWPQLWEQNQYILDAHWIYPGDPLIVTGVAQAFTQPQGVVGPPLDEPGTGAEMDPFDSPIEEPEPLLESSDLGIAGPPSSSPVALGYEADIYCTGYIGGLEEEFPFRVAGSEYDYLTPQLDLRHRDEAEGRFGKASTEKFGLGLGDIVYLDGGRAEGLSAGELLTAVRPREKLRHPLSRDVLGRVYAYLGRIRVLSVQDETAIAEIVQLCTPIPLNTSLKYFEPEPVPLRRITPIRPVNYPADNSELVDAAVIIGSVDNMITGSELITLGAGYLVLIDRGAAQDAAPGDIFTIYRRTREGYPPTVLGELAVLSTFEDTSLARILRSRYAIYVGDPMVIK